MTDLSCAPMSGRDLIVRGIAASLWWRALTSRDGARWRGQAGRILDSEPPVMARDEARRLLEGFEAANGGIDAAANMEKKSSSQGPFGWLALSAFGRALCERMLQEPSPVLGSFWRGPLLPHEEALQALSRLEEWRDVHGDFLPFRITLSFGAESPETAPDRPVSMGDGPHENGFTGTISLNLMLDLDQSDAIDLRLLEVVDWLESNGVGSPAVAGIEQVAYEEGHFPTIVEEREDGQGRSADLIRPWETIRMEAQGMPPSAWHEKETRFAIGRFCERVSERIGFGVDARMFEVVLDEVCRKSETGESFELAM